MLSGCRPAPAERCARAYRPVRATKTVVRPGRKNGGTTIAFTLSRRGIVRFTVVRVYPSCKRIGSFTVRAHEGANRVRFRGRLGRRPLPEGTYRLLVQVRGQEDAVASVPIVVARGRVSAKELRRARRANSCSSAEARTIAAAVGVGSGGTDDGSRESAVGGSLGERVIEPVVGAARGVARAAIEVANTGRSIPGRIGDSAGENPFADPVVLTMVGLILLGITLLGTLVLLNLVRIAGLRDRMFR